MTLHTALMIAAIIILIINIILTLLESYHYYKLSFAPDSPRILPTSHRARLKKKGSDAILRPGDEIREDTVVIDGIHYNVRWILRSERKKEDIIYEDTDSIKIVK